MFFRSIRLVVAFTAFLLIPSHALGESSWAPIGPNAGTIFSLIRDPFATNRWFAGTYFGGLYKSENAGTSWDHVPSPFSTKVVFALAADANTPGKLFAGILDSGIYQSLDSGETWSQITNGIGNASIESIAFDPANSSNILATAFEGVYRSNDGGVSWNLSNGGVTNFPARTLLYTKQSGEVLAGTSGLGIYRSVDSGITWKAYSDGMGKAVVNRLSENQETEQIYAASNQGIYRLNPGNNRWESITWNLAGTNVNQVLPVSSNLLLAATDFGLFKLIGESSTNWIQWGTFPARIIFPGNYPGSYFTAALFDSLLVTYNMGQTFIRADNGIQNRFVGSLTTLNASGQTVLYAGTDYGVEFSSEAFRSNSILPWITGGRFSGGVFAVTPASSNRLFAAIERDGVWKGENYGTQWSRSSDGLLPRVIHALSQSGTGRKTIFAGTTDGLYISTNNGVSWFPDRTTRTPHAVSAVAAHPLREGVVFYGTSEGSFYRSFDNADTAQISWRSPTGDSVQAISIAPFFNLYLVAGGQLYVSTDDGANFFLEQEIKETVLSVAADPVRPWTVYAGTSLGGIYRSTNNAISFEQANTGLKVPIVYSLAIDPTNSTTVYAGTLGKVYISTNSAESWTESGPGLAGGAVLRLEIDPNDRETLYASMADGGIFTSTNAGAKWSLIASPGEGNGLAILPGRSGTNVLLAGTLKGGIMRSVDRGETWQASNEGMTIFIKCIAIDPKNPANMYAGSLVDGIFKSMDSGQHWNAMGLADRAVYGVAIDPVNPANVYLATSSGIAISRDYGETWFDRGQQTAYIFDVLNNPQDTQQMLIAGGSGDFFKSEDGGESWIVANNGLPGANTVSIAADWNAGMIYAAVEREGIYKSSDGGRNWVSTNQSNLEGAPILSLALEPWNGFVLAGSDSHGVFLSTNKGGSWNSQGLTNRDQVNGFAFDRQKRVAWAATSTGITRSTDDGHTWNQIGQRAAYVLQMLVDPRDRNTIYVGSIGGQIFRSTDGGEEWVPANQGLPELSIFALAMNSSNGVLYASPEQAGVYRSTNNGESWELTEQTVLGNAKITSLTVNPLKNEVFAATDGSGLFISRDGGTKWELLGLTNYDQVFAVRSSSFDPETFYASTSDGFLKSINGGQNWGTLGQKEPYILQIVANPKTGAVFASSYAGKIHRSIDSGKSWQPATNGLPKLSIFALGLDLPSGTLYAAPERDGIYQSLDNGTNWTRIDTAGLSNALVMSLTVVPDNGNIYAATAGSGLFVSTDLGKTWALKTNGLQSVYVSSVALDPNQPDTLYASTLSETGSGAGLYRSINAGEIWVPITNGIPTASILQVLASRNIAGRLYAASARYFFRSDDYGANWSSVGAGLQGQEIGIIFQDQFNPGEVLYAGTTNGVYKSINGGADWVGTSNVQPNISISGFAETTNGIFAATLGTGVWSSADGLDWQGGLNPLLAHPVAFTILEDYRFGEVLYGIVTRDGVVRSSDGGSTWTICTNGLISTNVLSLTQDRQSGKIYAGTADNGVFVSEDQAATWKQVPSEFSGLNVPFLEPGTGSNLYVGTLGHGLLKSLDSGAALTGGVIPELVDPLMLGVHNTESQPQVLFAPIDPSGVITSTNGGLTWRYAKQGIEKVRVRKIAFDPVNPDLMLATAYAGGIYR
ncbi:MAG: YCF48-related protein, partial [Verrucomicrobiota bacterium]